MALLEYRELRLGDEVAVRELYRTAFGLELGAERWRWCYQDLPVGRSYV